MRLTLPAAMQGTLRASRVLPALMCATLLSSCRARPQLGAIPSCHGQDVDTTGWLVRVSQQRSFTINLPRHATVAVLTCIDSGCGRFDLPGWAIDYDDDGFTMHRPADTLRASNPATACWEQIDGRPAVIETFPAAIDASTTTAHASIAITPSFFMFIGTRTKDPTQVAVFLAAVRSIHFLPRR